VNWQAFYDSPFSHPGLAWAFALTLGGRLAVRFPRSGLRVVLALLLAETALDAWLTGAWTPLDPASPLAQNVGIAFVILGDLRLFVLLERFGRGRTSWRSAALRALALSLVVPVLQGAAVHFFPDTFGDLRRVFLVYEALFVMLGTGLLLARWPSTRAASPELGWYATRLLVFFLVQYGLWVVCDALILSGQAWALGLRVLPNAMYYGLFLYAAAYFAPDEAWS
jgi:hypothetical protein